MSQRSKANLSEVRILPVSPIRQSPADQAKMQARWNSLFQKSMLTENERFGLTRLQEQGDFRLLPGCCYYDTATNLEGWLTADTVWVLPGLTELRDMLFSAECLWTEALEAQDVEGRPQPQRLAIRGANDAESACERFACIHAEPLVMGVAKEAHDLPERSLSSFEDLFPSIAEQDRPWQTLVQSLKRWQIDKRQTILCFASEKSRTKFLNLASQDGLAPFTAVFGGTAWPVRFGGTVSGWR